MITRLKGRRHIPIHRRRAFREKYSSSRTRRTCTKSWECPLNKFSAPTQIMSCSLAEASRRSMRSEAAAPLMPGRLLRLVPFVLRHSSPCTHTGRSALVTQKPSRTFWSKEPGQRRLPTRPSQNTTFGGIRLGMSQTRQREGLMGGGHIWTALFVLWRQGMAWGFHWGFGISPGCYLFAADSQRQDCASRLCLMIRHLFLRGLFVFRR